MKGEWINGGDSAIVDLEGEAVAGVQATNIPTKTRNVSTCYSTGFSFLVF